MNGDDFARNTVDCDRLTDMRRAKVLGMKSHIVRVNMINRAISRLINHGWRFGGRKIGERYLVGVPYTTAYNLTRGNSVLTIWR